MRKEPAAPPPIAPVLVAWVVLAGGSVFSGCFDLHSLPSGDGGDLDGSGAADGQSGTGGSAPAGSGGVGGPTGGRSGSGGGPAGSGGAGAGTGGSAVPGTGGGAVAGSGGAVGTGGAVTGSGGQGRGPGGSGTGGSGTGGSGTGGSGTGGSGTGGVTGSGGAIGPVTLMPLNGPGTPSTFAGFTHMTACASGDGPSDCDASFSGSGTNCQRLQTWVVSGGTPGMIYTVEVNFVGLVECKVYNGCARRNTSTQLGTNTPTANPLDLLCTGGTVPLSAYNSWEFRVQNNPPIPGTTELAALNAGPTGCELHYTYPIRSNYAFQVRQGSVVSFRLFDSNCRAISNCGQDANSYMTRATCNAGARTIPGVTLPPQFYGSQYSIASRGPGQPFDAQFVQIQLVGIVPPM
jgi:hypothetical protein